MSEPARSTDVASDDLEPCPFERGTCDRECLEIVVETDSSKRPGVFHGYVKCCDCGASGPEAWADEDSIRSLAIFGWNDRARIRAPITDAGALQSMPTEAMLDEAIACAAAPGFNTADSRDITMLWQAMLAAAPAHPIPQGEAEPAAWRWWSRAGEEWDYLDNDKGDYDAYRAANPGLPEANFVPLYTRPPGEAGDTDELVETRCRKIVGDDAFLQLVFEGYSIVPLSALTSLRAERDEARAAYDDLAGTPLGNLRKALAAEKQRAAQLQKHLDEADAATFKLSMSYKDQCVEVIALKQRVVELTERSVETQMLAFKWMEAHDRLAAGKPYDYPTTADKPEAIARAEAAETQMRAILEALEPFAKTGELFETPAYDKYTATVFAPAAGSEYALTSSQLRRATEVFRAALAPVTTPPEKEE